MNLPSCFKRLYTAFGARVEICYWLLEVNMALSEEHPQCNEALVYQQNSCKLLFNNCFISVIITYIVNYSILMA